MFDTVSVAVESSARAVVVLSPSYLAQHWPHIRQPFLTAVRSHNTKLVFLQLEEVTPDLLAAAPDLSRLLDDSPRVRWGDPAFWNKLRYFLPEPVYLTFHRYNYTAYK